MEDVLQEHIYLALTRHEPHPAHEARLRAVAGAWAEEVDKIIGLMFRYKKEVRNRQWTSSVREEAIYELARLMFWLSDLVVKKKLEERAINELDPESERASASSATGLERIENTARIFADNIRHLLELSLGNKMLRRDWTKQDAKPYWGRLKQG